MEKSADGALRWNGRYQKEIKLKNRSKGAYLVTNEVVDQIQDGLKNQVIGMLFLTLLHTSAALSLNENCDPDVRTDMTMALDTLVPESLPWDHVDEGPDDSVSHTKSTLVGVSLQVPIQNGRLKLGTWQGIYLLEFREMAHTRRVLATIM